MHSFDEAYYRGITIRASPEIIFKWLCQMRIAPYSYDWIDNWGRKSPETLIPGLDRLEIGLRVMTIFDLIEFDLNSHLTIRMNKDFTTYKVFGDVAASYLIKEEAAGICRLLVKLLVRYPKGLIGKVNKAILPRGDLIMMRKQLFNFKKLSERSMRK